ncbi:2Fe-2S iron-sulfur cluster binding domain-containing protein [Ralstonia pickettii]|jgi:3-phenylpropionate/trans-cinnamate dioxygenase ferredoxin reductase subunit|uniref:Ferredoxin n=3 Tax=Ralstonia TaxID=48736 RepID=C6BL51_RALP1|nr:MULTISPECIES: 2Fe-2S iron-sulfur cluster binding domain-containing protein [Ralstonia]MDE2201538.1 2Fe-2S iron-sulfur cluster binding domain-containing protein [Burkholderiaceae bacterium]MBA9883184.1 ferredoxin [Ralstonia pickettii]MBA9892960.1 ferredoxin [Ralstonia pickettii]MBA9925025.1 ferredoxin [Ralstonia pickettii]MBB0093528.1 ferredoxin [Ralstonia pickettii]
MLDTRPKVDVCVEQTQEHYACATTESLLTGMLRLGRKGIPVGCVNGGCGVCKVRVLDGSTARLGPLSRAHVSADEEAQGVTLACREAPLTAVRLAVLGKFEKPFSRGFAASAGAQSDTKPQ